jgi:hypothetical protein
LVLHGSGRRVADGATPSKGTALSMIEAIMSKIEAIMNKIIESILASPIRWIAIMIQLAILLQLFEMNKNLREINSQTWETKYYLGILRDELATRR